MERKEASNWVHQTIQLFPAVDPPPSQEFIAALIQMICTYPADVVMQVLAPASGVATKYEFLPSLAKFKLELDLVAQTIGEKIQSAERLKEQLKERSMNQPKTTSQLYEGPIEHIKPGDRISWRRSKEYDDFMAQRHGMRNIKRWTEAEIWIDSGARPFSVKLPEKTEETKNQEKNPFEDL